MQILSYRPGIFCLVSRILLVFVMILICVFDHTLYVYAYSSQAKFTLFGGFYDSDTKFVSTPVYPSSSTVISGKLSSTNFVIDGESLIYDLCIPVSLQVNTVYSNDNYAVSGLFVPQFFVRPSRSLTYLGMSYEGLEGNASSVFSGLPLSGFITKSDVFSQFYIQFRYFDMPFRYDYSSIIYVHIYFQATKLLGTSSYVNFDLYTPNQFTIDDSHITAENSEVGKLQDIQDTIEDNRQEDKDDATQGGEDAADLVTNLDSTIKSKWEILWYPLEFTQRVASVFGAGTSSASYKAIYADVVDYRYDESSGYLVPVRDPVRAQARAGGTIISFPSFEMMGMQIWDSYDFDLSQLKLWFPELFNLLYVAVSILEVYWFVSFLRSKYDEVFG